MPNLPYELWSIVAVFALGAIFWIPRFQERLPGRPMACPQGVAASIAAEDPDAPPLAGKAFLPGAFGSARLIIKGDSAEIERTEDPIIRWILCPLAFLVGTSLMLFAGAGVIRRRRRPKAAILYTFSLCIGAQLAWTSARSAGFEQSIHVAYRTVGLDTSEFWGLWTQQETFSEVDKIAAWGSGTRFDVYSLPARKDSGPKACGWLLRARWIEPELLSALNQALQTRPSPTVTP